jgi:hypothetical protein
MHKQKLNIWKAVADSSQYSRTEWLFRFLEKVKTKKINLLTWNSDECEITLSTYATLKHVIEWKIGERWKWREDEE